MITPPTLPAIPGLGWSRHKKPTFSTRVAPHVSGREVRVAQQAYPLYEFEATYNALGSAAGYSAIGANSLQTLMGFYLQMQGQFGTFLYVDADDNAATAQGIGTGDGTTTTFTFIRALGGFVEPVGWVTALTAVYLNGTLQGSGYSLATPNTLTFTAAPGSGVVITADFSFAFVCRFLEDQVDFEEMMSNLWQLQSLKFRSVKP